MLIVIKGAGDLASGIAYRLKKSGFDVVMTEIENPTTVRRTVAFSQAIFDNETIIEGIKGIKVNSIDEINEVISQGNIPVMIDEKAEIVSKLKPNVVVDSIIAKKNLGTSIDDAPIVIGVGPGFEAKIDCDLVIETKRGQVVAYVDKEEVLAQIDGIVRGMLQENIEVFKGMKAGDIDPRCEKDHCFTISDKARSIGGGVLEAIMYMSNKNK